MFLLLYGMIKHSSTTSIDIYSDESAMQSHSDSNQFYDIKIYWKILQTGAKNMVIQINEFDCHLQEVWISMMVSTPFGPCMNRIIKEAPKKFNMPKQQKWKEMPRQEQQQHHSMIIEFISLFTVAHCVPYWPLKKKNRCQKYSIGLRH